MGSIARAVSSVAQPVSGGSTSFPTGGMFGSGLGQLFSQLINQGALTPATGLPVTIPTGEYNEPVTPQVTPTTSMSPIRRFNAVVDPRLSRTMSRPMFRTSRYDSQINNLLGKLLPDSAPSTPQLRPVTDPMGRSYSDPRYYKMGGRVNYQDGGSSKTPPKFIPMDLESVAKRLFERNLDNLTYNEKQSIYDYIEANRNKKAYGGRIGYADGTPAAGLAIRLNRPVQSGDPLGSYYDDGKGPLTPGFLNDSYGPVNSLTGLRSIAMDRTQPVERKIGLFTYPDGSYPGENMPNPIQALPRPGQYSTQIQSPSQTESIREALMSLPQTRSNPQMNAMRRYSQVRDPRITRLLQQRQPRAMGGIMNLKMGGMPVEMDLRAKGGFVPIGKRERADDVPARLSKNEFVFTANAVRNAGGGDIRKGAKRMYNLMNQLEAKR